MIANARMTIAKAQHIQTISSIRKYGLFMIPHMKRAKATRIFNDPTRATVMNAPSFLECLVCGPSSCDVAFRGDSEEFPLGIVSTSSSLECSIPSWMK